MSTCDRKAKHVRVLASEGKERKRGTWQGPANFLSCCTLVAPIRRPALHHPRAPSPPLTPLRLCACSSITVPAPSSRTSLFVIAAVPPFPPHLRLSRPSHAQHCRLFLRALSFEHHHHFLTASIQRLTLLIPHVLHLRAARFTRRLPSSSSSSFISFISFDAHHHGNRSRWYAERLRAPPGLRRHGPEQLRIRRQRRHSPGFWPAYLLYPVECTIRPATATIGD